MTREDFLRRSATGALTITSLVGPRRMWREQRGQDDGRRLGKPPGAPTGAVTLALPGAPPSLDPTTSFSANDLPVTGNLYESLLRYDGELRPSLATRYASNADADSVDVRPSRGREVP